MAKEVFLSYHKKDTEKVKAVKAEIECELGVSCWMDDWTNPEDTVIEKIVNSPVFLYMLSPTSMSEAVTYCELFYAKSHAQHIILVEIEPCGGLNDYFKFNFSDYDILTWDDPMQRKQLMAEIRSQKCK